MRGMLCGNWELEACWSRAALRCIGTNRTYHGYVVRGGNGKGHKPSTTGPRENSLSAFA